jgi:hypothetical protein
MTHVEEQPVLVDEAQVETPKAPVKTTTQLLAELGDLNALTGTELTGFGGGSL